MPATIKCAEPPGPSRALLLNISAFLLWASATLVFKALDHLPVWDVFAYRVIGSLGWCALLLWLGGSLTETWQTLRSGQERWQLLISSGLIACNWFLVIWAVAHNRLLDASLGYYLSPVLSVVLAHLLFGEPWGRREQLTSALCLCGVAMIVAGAQDLQVPWTGLVIAMTFALYSAVKKRCQTPALIGLGVETTLVALPAAALLLLSHWDASASIGPRPSDWLWLVLLGLITTVPMWLYIASVKALSLTTVGFLQYLNPTLMFILAITLFGETFSGLKLAGFALIWCALAGLLLSNALRWQRTHAISRPKAIAKEMP